MEGNIPFFLALILVGVILLVAGLRRANGIKKSSHCSNCETPMSMRRVSRLKSLLFLTAWECPHCATKTGSWISISRSGTL